MRNDSVVRVALAQVNPTVGDLRGNAQKMREAFGSAIERNAGFVVFPAGALSGMPLGGLAADADFLRQGASIHDALSAEFAGKAFIREIFRSAVPPVINPRIVVRSNANQYQRGCLREAWQNGLEHAAARNVWVVDCNLVGGQDETVYPGGGFVACPNGDIWTCSLFRQDLVLVDIDLSPGTPQPARAERVAAPGFDGADDVLRRNDAIIQGYFEGTEETYLALTLAIKDYTEKCGLAGAAVSLSGGIDSALVVTLAVDALGADRVKCMTLPGPFTSAETLADARLLAANLGVSLAEIAIIPAYETVRESLRQVLVDGPNDPEDLAGQNLQARLRGMYLMALANRQGLLALNCSNKSEAMVGYGTLYGDMIGGFAPLRDIWKTQVWDLSRHANSVAGRERIPQSIIERIPSAELRHNQEDRQSIPDYPVLDAILGHFVDDGVPYGVLIGKEFAEADIRKAVRLNYASAFKRQQAPLGPIISAGAKGDREAMPVVNRFRAWECDG